MKDYEVTISLMDGTNLFIVILQHQASKLMAIGKAFVAMHNTIGMIEVKDMELKVSSEVLN